MSRIQRFVCGAAIGAASCLMVIAVLAEDPFGGVERSGDEPAAALPAEDGTKAAAAKSAATAETSANDGPQPLNFCRCAGQGSAFGVARIEKALGGPLHSNGLDFAQVPLEEIVNLLQDEYGIPIQLNEAALQATGLDPTEPVTINLHNVSLRSALRLMLERLQLTYIVREEVLQITTPDDADAHLITCVYDVRPFLGDATDESVKSLMDTIVSCVQKDTWSKDGKGEAEIRFLKPSLFVISQTYHAHDEITGLLNTIYKMREKSAEGDVAGK